MAPSNQLQIQSQSNGILPDLDAAGWHICYYSEDDVNRRDEEYYFPCSKDHQCCGRECCIPVAQSGFPLWLAILLAILALLFLIALLALLYYMWTRTRKKNTAPPAPAPTRPVTVHKEPPSPPRAVKTYRRLPSNSMLRRISDSNLTETRADSPANNTITTVTVEESDYRSLPRNGRYSQRYSRWSDEEDEDEFGYGGPRFVPSRMRESYESTPTPIPVVHHAESEFTQEVRPLLSRVQPPEEQKAVTVYYKPGSDRVASYNELPK